MNILLRKQMSNAFVPMLNASVPMSSDSVLELKGMKWTIGVGIAVAGAIGPIVTRILS